MFELLEKLEQAKKNTDTHYFSCLDCDRYYKNYDSPKCEIYLDLCEVENRVKTQINNYKIDIQ